MLRIRIRNISIAESGSNYLFWTDNSHFKFEKDPELNQIPQIIEKFLPDPYLTNLDPHYCFKNMLCVISIHIS